MATPPWSPQHKSACQKGCYGFSLSPRQLANKVHTLAMKKLDGDDKRNRPHYSVRERLLLCSTITKAEGVLNKSTIRTNRRIFDIDDLEAQPSEQVLCQPHVAQHAYPSESDDLTAQNKPKGGILVETTQAIDASITYEHVALLVEAANSQLVMIPDPPMLRDCRPIMTQRGQNAISGSTVAVII